MTARHIAASIMLGGLALVGMVAASSSDADAHGWRNRRYYSYYNYYWPPVYGYYYAPRYRFFHHRRHRW